MILAASFYEHVPKLPDANLRFRLGLIEAARRDRGLQRDLLYACKHDILFWINTFGWLYHPKAPRGQRKVLPFVTYPDLQDGPISTIKWNIGQEKPEDMVIEKSRDLGGTWMVSYVFAHEFLFEEFESFGVVSRDMEAVDKTGDTDTLFWKLRFILGLEKEGIGLPTWMLDLGQVTSNKGALINQARGNRIMGYAATGDVMSGGRKKAVLLDEFAKFPSGADFNALSSTQFVTDCRILMSTPDPDKGASGAFYEQAMKARK